jgi:hypothetical protein
MLESIEISNDTELRIVTFNDVPEGALFLNAEDVNDRIIKRQIHPVQVYKKKDANTFVHYGLYGNYDCPAVEIHSCIVLM